MSDTNSPTMAAPTITELPNVLRACLSDVGEINDPLTDAELQTFLDTYTGGGCELGDDCTNTVKGQVTWFKSRVAQGASRHDTMTSVGPWVMSEAMGGCYSAREVFGLLKDAFTAEYDYDDDPARFVYLADEYTRMMAWAAAQASPDRAHREPEIDEARIWSATTILKHIQTAWLARQMDPRGVLAVVLARVIASIPPYVTLPGITASRASVNLHVALVGPSSGGKSSSVAVAKEALAVAPEPDTTTLGSGEGIAKAYAYRDRSGLIITVTDTLLFVDTEIESVEALAKRNASPLMSQWRKTFTGERLGFGYADPRNRIPVLEHRYRFCQILGIQPELASWLLSGTQKSGGTPQRILWAPVVYPDMPKPEDAPVWPGQMTLPTWPLPGQKSQNGNNGQNAKNATSPKLAFSIVIKNVDSPAETKVLQENELQVPADVETMIRQARWRFHRGEVDDLSGHGTLTRLKVAAGFMWLDGRTDKITDEDWELAGIVMAISDASRTQTVRALAHKTHQADAARGKSEGRRERAKAGVLADARRKDIERVIKRVIPRLATADDRTMSGADLRRAMRDVPREVFDEVMVVLADEGRVVAAEVEYRGNTGWKYTID